MNWFRLVETTLEILGGSYSWKNSFKIGPAFAIAINVLLACLLSLVTNNDVALLDQGIRMSNMVSGASIQIVTLTFSLTVVSVQLASQSYSPRLLEEFIRDPVAKSVISVNLGTYAYSFVLNYYLFDDGDDPSVPVVAIHFLTFQMLVVLASFINFIHFFINGFRLENILSRARESCFKAARAAKADPDDPLTEDELPVVPSNAYKVTADASGYITRFRMDKIVALAEEMDVYVKYTRLLGDFVIEGTILAYVWDAQTTEENEDGPLSKRVIEHMYSTNGDLEANSEVFQKTSRSPTRKSTKTKLDNIVEDKLGVLVSEGVVLSKKRSGEQDITLGIQQLSDTAMRALSPGVNDPQTAIQCMDVLSVVLGRLVDVELGIPHAYDKEGLIRIWGQRRSFSYFLSQLDPIRHYGGSDLVVVRRGIRLFGDLGSILTRKRHKDRIPTILAQLEQWLNVGKKNFPDKSPEYLSIKALYDHVMENIAVSETSVVSEEEIVPEDLQDLEITHDDPAKKAAHDDDPAKKATNDVPEEGNKPSQGWW